MNPTLQEPEILEVEPCRAGEVHSGDVVLFVPDGHTQSIVHRVIRVTATGIVTCGDNNRLADPWSLRSENILGRVVAAQRGSGRRPICGGHKGMLWVWLLARQRALQKIALPRLKPIYRRLAASGMVYYLTPQCMHPSLIYFAAGNGRQMQLLWRKRVVGTYDHMSSAWQIQFPFRLFIDPALPGLTADQKLCPPQPNA